jgi:UDP-N-acetylmuramoylalanine--D-glutamate ligase
MPFGGQRVVIVGLARQGSALARFLCAQGARVVVTDTRPASELQAEVATLGGLPVRYVFGGHPFALLDECDLLCLSGGVPPETPLPQEARRRGIPLSNDSLLTLHMAPAQAVGITGSSGKTTTTSLVGEMLGATGMHTWVGGNIGTPLIDRVGEIASDHRMVLELSSFQLQLFGEADYPANHAHPMGGLQVAGVLNITPNHLDRHASMAHYTAAKANILRYQQEQGARSGAVAVLGVDNDVTGRWWREGRVDIEAGPGQEAVHLPILARIAGFSLTQKVPEGAFLHGNRLIWRTPECETVVCSVDQLKLPGRHNVANVLAALAISGAAGATPEAMAHVATQFSGVAHRLELVRERDGVRWYDDSIATTPERVVAALRSFDDPLVLLAGGRDKQLPWGEMADLALERVRHLILFGEAANLIAAAIDEARTRRPARSDLEVHICHRLDDAVEMAARVAQPGDVVLLSPGGTSFDAYRDFEHRGQHFRALVVAL